MRAELMMFCFTIWRNLSQQPMRFSYPKPTTRHPQHPPHHKILRLSNTKPGNE